jgi:hypothetical protein
MRPFLELGVQDHIYCHPIMNNESLGVLKKRVVVARLGMMHG